MRRAFLFLLLCALAVLLPIHALAEEENLLQNGGFEEAHDGWPLYWEEDMWLFDVGVSNLVLLEEGRDGGLCAVIENVQTNDARFTQTVDVKPDTIYELSGWVKAEGCSEEFAGASLSLVGTFEIFPDEHDTNGEWVELTTYVETAADQYTLTVGARLGDYASDNVGTAWFDDISFVEVEAVPIGVMAMKLRDYSAPMEYEMPEEPVEEVMPTRGDSSPIVGAVLLLVLLALLWVMRARGVSLPGWTIWVVLVLAALVRLYLMATNPGFPNDMMCFFGWSNDMFKFGPNAFYEIAGFRDYPPGYMYPLWFTGWLMQLFGAQQVNGLGRVIIKLVPMLADLVAVYLVWRLARKRFGESPALLLAALYALSPAVLVDGAMWGQVDAVIALGLLVTVLFAAQGNWKVALPVFVVTVLMKPQALMVGPIGLVAFVLDGMKRKDKKFWINALLGVGGSLLVAAAMLLPFIWGKANPLDWIVQRYVVSLGAYEYATLSATNLYYLLGGNWVPLDQMFGPLSVGMWGTILTVLSVLGVIVLYVRKGNRDALPFYCALTFIALYLFGVKMHERYLFPALLLLLYAYIRRPDRRILFLFAGYSLTFYITCALVLRDVGLPSGFGLAGCALSLANLLLFGVAIWVALDGKTQRLTEWVPNRLPKLNRLPALEGRTPPMARMRSVDWALMLGLTAVYAVIAFVGLGSTVAPQTGFASTDGTEVVSFDLGSVKEFNILYYAGVNTRDHVFTVEFSSDGESWTEASPASVKPGDCFRWQYVTQAVFDEEGKPVSWMREPSIFGSRYVQIVFEGPALTLMEVAFRDRDGNILPVLSTNHFGAFEEGGTDPAPLYDEPATVPDAPSYYNGTYFDEIYHARTGYEHAFQMPTYETTHPPLGKVMIMLGIKLFGMTPFGWRCMGALMGVLMVPMMYLLGKLLFKRTRFAFLAAFVMAFDMMHLTQTRIATIDSYAVLCIIIMYLCMFRYLQMSFFRDGWRTLVPLGLSGLFMGLGCASKWICFYAGAGLAVLFAWSMVQRFLEWRAAVTAGDGGGEIDERAQRYPRYLVGTLGACLLFFIIIPFGIYYASYIPWFASEGGLTLQRFIDAQTSMFNYHATLTAPHDFMSAWYEWPLILKPMYYYNGKPYIPEGLVSTIMSMGNPAVWWAGLGSLLYVFYRWLKPHLQGVRTTDHRPAMILLAFAAQLVPWVFVTRAIFIYHYFGSLPFVMLCIVYAFEQLHAWKPKVARNLQLGYMGIVLLLFIGFYPIATGAMVPTAWADTMNWLGFLKLPSWKYRGWLFY